MQITSYFMVIRSYLATYTIIMGGTLAIARHAWYV